MVAVGAITTLFALGCFGGILGNDPFTEAVACCRNDLLGYKYFVTAGALLAFGQASGSTGRSNSIECRLFPSAMIMR